MKLFARRPNARSRSATLVGLCGLAAFAFAPPLLAQPKAGAGARPAPTSASPAGPSDVLATVLALDGEDLVLDLGAGQGATEGALVEIWRPFKLRHPVTGKVLEDRFRIGTLELGQVRNTMSLARPTSALSRTAEKGDVILFKHPGSNAAAPSPSPSEAPTVGSPEAPTPEGAPLDVETQKVSEMFESLRGADLTTRIRRYEGYAQAFPNSRYSTVLLEEAAALRHLVELTLKPSGVPAQNEERAPRLVRFEGPTELIAGQALELVVELNDIASGALLHTRRGGETLYTTTSMVKTGPGFWSARVAPEKVVPSELEYFIEGTDARGAAVPLVGDPRAPKVIDILPVPKVGPPSKTRASALLLTDYADYNGLKGNDYVWQTEGTFGLRYGDVGVRALRTGFGVYRGVGGSLRELDELKLKGRAVGLTYGYLELEIGLHRFFSIGGRAAIGLQDDGLSGGGQILFRIGNDMETNLLLGGELLGGIGLRGITQLELNSLKNVPILIRTEVTNQPAGEPSDQGDGTATARGQVGVRTILQAGYRFTPELVISARISFQGRTINHAGPGVGGAVGYAW